MNPDQAKLLADALAATAGPGCRFRPCAPAAPTPRRLLHNSREARELLGGISESAFRRITSAGQLPTVRQGSRIYVTRDALEGYVSGLTS